MNIEELRAMKDRLISGEDLRITVEWDNARITGYLARILDDTFTLHTDVGTLVGPFNLERMIGLPLRVRPML